MNPLVVFGRFGKLPNAFLRDEEPIRRADFAAGAPLFTAGTGAFVAATGAAVGFAAGVAGAVFAPGITAGFTAGTGAPGAGFAFTPAASSAALVSLVCFCCSDFAVLRALSMASAFCATAVVAADPLTTSAIAKMPVVNLIVSFIAIPTSPPAFPVWSRRLPLKVVDRD